MRLSNLFTKTSRDVPADETSKNAQLLIKAGFVHKTMAGVYSYLPLGLRVLNKIENIVRKHMNAIGGQEILMNSLHPKAFWETTGRWDSVDILFKLESQTKTEYALACSHEEQVVPIAKNFIKSWKDLPITDPENHVLPLSVYQIQTKFRDELRAKSGILRGREFKMKDMYDFHRTQESFDKYYEMIKQAYLASYTEMGMKAYVVEASGGIFTENMSHEFQVICEAGEDEILYSEEGNFACNMEVYEDLKQKGDLPSNLTKAVSAEVGNIFKYGDKYTKAFELTYKDENNEDKYPLMGAHGIGITRCMGIVAELYNDEKGLKWPKTVAPFEFHIVTNINEKDDENVNNQILSIAQNLYLGKFSLVENDDKTFNLVENTKVSAEEILWDDRQGISMGEKLKDADLIGCAVQIIISKKSLENGGIEIKIRETGENMIVKLIS